MDPAFAYQLCFDLGKTMMGYAGLDQGRLTFYGRISHKRYSDAEIFKRTYALCKKLNAKVQASGKKIDCVTFEAAERQIARAGEVYFTQAAALKVFAHDLDVPLYKVYSSSIKKHVGGDGGIKTKEPVISGINKLFGLELDAETEKDDDIADAIAAGVTAIDLYKRRMLRESP